MGYRRAAMMRRTQHVSSHWRTSKNGKHYQVSSHTRNAPLCQPHQTVLMLLLFIAGFLTYGIAWIALFVYFINAVSD